VPLEVGGEDFKLDLLFYHLKLRYLAAADDMLRHADDQLSIGLILCKAKNRILAGYALRNTTTPMGISEFRHLEELPKRLKGTLPTIEEIEAELAKPQEPPR